MSVAEQPEEFRWRDIVIRQKRDVFKIGTDALLLGSWIPTVIKNPSRILDAGTGSGILALMLAHYFPEALISAVDDEAAAVNLAIDNFQNSVWSDRLIARQENIMQISDGERAAYKLIVCNPPYYFDQLRARDGVKSSAKHAYTSSSEWLEAFTLRLKVNGHICVILPYPLAFEWIEKANALGLFCHHRMDIFSFRDDLQPIRSLLDFHSSLSDSVLDQLFIYEKKGIYTEEYISFTGIQTRVK